MAFLIAIIVITFSYFFENRKSVTILLLTYVTISFLFPELCFFMPLIFFDAGKYKLYPCIFLMELALFKSCEAFYSFHFIYLTFGGILALFCQYLIQKYDSLSAQHKKMRDDSTELNLLLKARNQSLLEKQDYEIYNATLQERNRIAREIHDNVGHQLSRSILMTGALKAINQDENCKESLDILQDTLSQAMNTIRTSVHNLHDDSVNLRSSIENIMDSFTFCKTRLEYDMSSNTPSPVRYAFISIIKEAMTNVTKHSNASLVTIIVQEHPAMYQLIIHDNGTKTSKKTFHFQENNFENTGIGLVNMYDRIKKLKGTIQFSQEDGFQIFISIPKTI